MPVCFPWSALTYDSPFSGTVEDRNNIYRVLHREKVGFDLKEPDSRISGMVSTVIKFIYSRQEPFVLLYSNQSEFLDKVGDNIAATYALSSRVLPGVIVTQDIVLAYKQYDPDLAIRSKIESRRFLLWKRPDLSGRVTDFQVGAAPSIFLRRVADKLPVVVTCGYSGSLVPDDVALLELCAASLKARVGEGFFSLLSAYSRVFVRVFEDETPQVGWVRRG